MEKTKQSFNMDSVNSKPNPSFNFVKFILSVLNLFAATFGVGSTGLPEKAVKAGTLGFIISYVIALCSMYLILDYLLYFSDEHGFTNYVDLYKVIGGEGVKKIILLFFLITNIGTLLFASNTFNNLLNRVAIYMECLNSVTSKGSLFFLVLVVFLLTPLNIKRKLEGFGWISYVSFTTASVVIILLIRTIMSKYEFAFNDVPIENKKILELSEVINPLNLVDSYFYCMFCLAIQTSYMDIYQSTANKTKSSFKVMTIGFLVVMTIKYLSFGLLGKEAFSMKKESLYGGEQFLTLFSKTKDIFIIVCTLFMIFAAIACFLFTYKATKENIGLMLFGQKYWDDKKDLNSINISLTLFIVTTVTLTSSAFIVANIPGLTIINYVVTLICPIVFMILPFYAYYSAKKSIVALVFMIMNIVFYLINVYEMVKGIISN